MKHLRMLAVLGVCSGAFLLALAGFIWILFFLLGQDGSYVVRVHPKWIACGSAVTFLMAGAFLFHTKKKQVLRAQLYEQMRTRWSLLPGWECRKKPPTVTQVEKYFLFV